MNDFKYHYLFTSFDLETFEMEDFRYNFVNITAFRLVDTNDVFVKETLKEMEKFSKQNNIKFKKNIAVEVKRENGMCNCSLLAVFYKPCYLLYVIAFEIRDDEVERKMKGWGGKERLTCEVRWL